MRKFQIDIPTDGLEAYKGLREVNSKALDQLLEPEDERLRRRETITKIRLEKIKPFKDHPFQVRDDEDMEKLKESIKVHGILHPILVRKSDNGSFELISGHRRYTAAKALGMETIPAVCGTFTDDEAIIAMVDANLQREHILPSEKAFAYKMKLDAMKRQAGRPAQNNSSPLGNNTSGDNGSPLGNNSFGDNGSPLGNNSSGMKSSDVLAEEVGESKNTIFRYIRLTYLLPALLSMVDNDKLPMRTAVEISYLPEAAQRILLVRFKAGKRIPSLLQAEKMKAEAKNGNLDERAIATIMNDEDTLKSPRLKLTYGKVRKYIPDSVPPEATDEYIIKALEFYAASGKTFTSGK